VKKTVFGATLALSVFIMSGCGDGIGDVTTGSGPSATPTPTQATPTPAPTAAPTATPGSSAAIACRLPRLPNCDAQCCSAGGSVIYRSQIESAQDELSRTQPGLFLPGGNVRDNVEYMTVLARLIQNRSDGNICAEVLGHDEIRVKGDQNVSQHVDVLIADVTPAVLGAYTCRPASF
jgi:hypothetical protein